MNKILGIHAGLSNPSSSEKLVSSICEKIKEKFDKIDSSESFEFEIISLRDYASEMLNSILTGFNSEHVESLMDKVLSSSGLVLVSPVMSAGYSSLFKMFVDVLPEGLANNKPILLGATAGTKRHSLVIDYGMKPVIDYHHANVIPYSVFAATEDWGNFSELSSRIDKASEEFANVLNNKNLSNVDESVNEKDNIILNDDYQINDSIFNGKTFYDLINE